MHGSGKYNPSDITAIGIAYQMHGLVAVNQNQEVLFPSIIWCDSRAVEIGNQAFTTLEKKNA
jgi:xylulokinase